MLLTNSNKSKRVFDIFFSSLGLILFCWLILICWLIATVETRSNGFFFQIRIGLHGKHFKIIKIKTMRADLINLSTITQLNDPRITRSGLFFRRYKLDELPQLLNVLLGQMSFVGPRPDVPGYADMLDESIRIILLSVKPGITGPASLAFRDEEELLASQANADKYNDECIYPEKVRINLKYINDWHFSDDLIYIIRTIFRYD